jgi:glycerol-3-phosphate dehydrogenase
MSVIGIVNGTPVGEALVARLQTDGRKVVSGVDASSLKRICSEARLVLVDARRADLPQLLRKLGEHLEPNHLVAHTVHGLGSEGSVAGLIEAESPVRRVGVLAGPLLTSALRQGTPTAAVIASHHPEVIEEFADALSTPHLRVYRSHDPTGVEICASLSELAVLACAMVDALQLGAAARALVVVRTVRELGRLVQALGGEPITATGLAGLGDIMVRGADESAPPYQLGHALATGGTPDPDTLEALRKTAMRLGQLNPGQRTSAHIFHGVAALLIDAVAPAALIEKLMSVRVLDE